MNPNSASIEDDLEKRVLESLRNKGLIASTFHSLFSTFYSENGVPSKESRILSILLLNGRVKDVPSREERFFKMIQKEEKFFFNDEEDFSNKIVSGQLIYLLLRSLVNRSKLWTEFFKKLLDNIYSAVQTSTKRKYVHLIFTIERFLFAPNSKYFPPLLLELDSLLKSIRIMDRPLRIHLTKSLVLSLGQKFLPHLPSLFSSLYNQMSQNTEILLEYAKIQAFVYKFCSSHFISNVLDLYERVPSNLSLECICTSLKFLVHDVEDCGYLEDRIIVKMLSQLEEIGSNSNNNNNNISQVRNVHPNFLLKVLEEAFFSSFRRFTNPQNVFLSKAVNFLVLAQKGFYFKNDLIFRDLCEKVLQRFHSILHPVSHPLFIPVGQNAVTQIFGSDWKELPKIEDDEEIIEEEEEEEEFYFGEKKSEEDEEKEKEIEQMEKEEKKEEKDMEKKKKEEDDDFVTGKKRKPEVDVEELRKENSYPEVNPGATKKRRVENIVEKETKKEVKKNEDVELDDEELDVDLAMVNFNSVGESEDIEKLDEIDLDE